ncbi:cysteine--tRNA ligase [Thermoactinomyces sp. DSM 45892]|uniref:cysteine--tRNA ligase n=1 Tax=Thermoactinomyces sp. DSM 45892 TaxID=1882753 RepID=UPI000899B02C|nr:cysteine--tRNA ligase [Thermoactinomyces sp. DSM 45892]SDY93696.1 cysteinyl-tRNA synthetase [Thermoactinomyces sp. DSM 45892]
MTIKLFNTLTRQKETLTTLEKNRINMYVCGPTVYSYIHIGNARCFVFFDVVRRFLEHQGYEVNYVQNFTDVDDRLINASIETGLSVPEIAERYIEAYFEDMDALGVKRATTHPRATENIQEMLEFIQDLIGKGYAYEKNGDVYFRSLKKEGYGCLSHHSLEDLKSGARVEVNDLKESPLDFALWKAAKPGEISWETPWGPGRPGWHIECSAMARRYLGDTLDIHAGGIDLCFPHHENEIAQSEAMTGETFVRYWLHNEFINMNNVKMSKSVGNVMSVVELRKHFEPLALRYFLLSTHYRNPMNFTEDTLRQADESVKRIQTAYENLQHRIQAAQSGEVDGSIVSQVEGLTSRFIAEMSDDFNSANAITVVFDCVRLANDLVSREVITQETGKRVINWFETFAGSILGLIHQNGTFLEDEIESLIEERQQARKNRDFALADAIRNQLMEQGIVLEDTPQGVRWKRK